MSLAATELQNVFTSAAFVLNLVGGYCVGKFAQGEGLSYLEKAVTARRTALRTFPPPNSLQSRLSTNLGVPLSVFQYELDRPLRSLLLNNLGHDLQHRYKQLGTVDDLEEAIVVLREALALRPPGDPNHSMSLSNLAGCLCIRSGKLGAIGDLEEAIALLKRTSEEPVVDPSRTALSLNNLGGCLFTLYSKVGVMNYLEEAITTHRRALELRSVGHPDRSVSLYNLARSLSTRYDRLGIMNDLEEAVTMDRAALELRPQGHLDRPVSLNGLGVSLQARFRILGAMEDLEEAIALHKGALDLCPPGHHLRSSSMTNIGVSISNRYSKLGTMEDLEEAIAMHRGALELHPPGDPVRFTPLHNIALCLGLRYERLGDMDDLEEAIGKFEDSLELLQPGNPRRFAMLNNLADRLLTRYEQLGMANDLERAIIIYRDVIDTLPSGHSSWSASMNNLGKCLSARYDLLGVASDLEEAIQVHRGALTLRPPGHPNRSSSLNSLALSLMTRYNHYGKLADLEEAIAMYRSALDLHPQGHPDRPTSLDNLGVCLRQRYDQLRVTSDLEDALTLHRDALELRPQGNPGRPSSLDLIGSCLYSRYDRMGIMDDLEESIMMHRNALELRSEGHPRRPNSLYHLARSLTARFQKLGDICDIENAITMSRDALRILLLSQGARATTLHGLGSFLFIRYSQLQEENDLLEAIAVHKDALNCRPHGHPLRAASLLALATCLSSQSERPDILEEAFDFYSELSHVSNVVSISDYKAARAWAYAADAVGHDSTVLAYRTSLRLLVHHLATVPSLPQSLAALKEFASSLAVDAFSACVRHKQLADAVELVEQGRSVFWTQYTRFRSPLDDVASAGDIGMELAKRFSQLTSLLRSILDSPPLDSPGTSQHDQAWILNVQLQDVLDDIRKLPDHSRFLLPLLFSDLRQAAAGGPVIIVNASKHSCDAVIILSDGDPIHIPLQITKEHVRDLSSRLRSLTSRVGDMTTEFGTILRKLREGVVSPIVARLEMSCPPRSRIWWCPTAEFSLLPLHAAGPYRRGELNLADLYISSYTPTLTELIHARQNGPSDPRPEKPIFFAIGQAEAPGQNKLASVNDELAHIAERIAPLATFATIKDEDASVAKVTEALGKTEYVHLACHGLADPKRPFESAFALRDGHLRIEDIMRHDLQQAQFAYLSACHTTAGDEESPDKVIHLAAAMHFAGFRSVVGTMWAVDDRVANEVTTAFYAQMVGKDGHLDHTRAASALHRTLRRLPKVPLDQRALFIHIGA